MNEINAVRMKVRASLPSSLDKYKIALEDAFWSCADALGAGCTVEVTLDILENYLEGLMNNEED